MLTKEIKDMSEVEITELFNGKIKEMFELVNQINEETDHTAVTITYAGLAQDHEDSTQVFGQGALIGSPAHLVTMLSDDDEVEQLAHSLTLQSIVSEMQEEADE